MLQFREEKWGDALGELQGLFPAHWAEVKREEPLDMNFAAYREMERLGSLLLVTARAEARLVGYWSCVLSPFLHSRSLRIASTDLLFISPPFRAKGTFFSLQKKVEEILLQKGISLWFVGEKISAPIGGALRWAGFAPDETVFVKKLPRRV